ncbi:hypothetical protein [Haloferax sp. DFSO60]|uniref:hypothetical protein n=1 Tax=Haloferax sp. DFSO60 TaxID=3388652 RepID=UPI00397CBAD9
MERERTVDDGRVRPHREMIQRVVLYTFAVVGLLFTLGIALGLAVDYATFDPTSGGYEPPYDDFSGEPIDWESEAYTTKTGMFKPGYVVDIHLDCTTGMLSFELLNGPIVNFRPVSDRAIAIHDPRDACRNRGFYPEF